MEDAFNMICKTLEFEPTKKERADILAQMENCYQYGYEPIIERGKNIGSKKDTYNIGHYLISKEKHSNTTTLVPSSDFIEKYVSDQDKKLFQFINTGNDATLDTFNIISMFYYKIKVLKIKKKMASIDDYLID
ncbi:hypothetical protein DLEV_068 [Diachasmimorpha longicaudata entomopoxvirus]|uniref:Uncharacterized protein n=1 Tax=Diachasmimorpha longicaudata entomopoxvirus TaxID=109981 RepID=A0A7R5WM11_9POXV|nr:hypothetical protein QKK69_gp068 [Diachasmimorpha longicaudata entomopoxvirus]AKS26359.1 hypothetical protein DLEV_068 [Diachasmimorpha longicaudata entomopoxvirus]